MRQNFPSLKGKKIRQFPHVPPAEICELSMHAPMHGNNRIPAYRRSTAPDTRRAECRAPAMIARIRPVVGVLVALLCWEALSRSGLPVARTLPPPSVVLVALVHLLGERAFLAGTASTALCWLIAVVLAGVLGGLLGLALGSTPRLRAASTFVVEFVRPLPAVALIPLMISVLSADARAAIALATFAAIWPVLFATLHALGEVDPSLLVTARTFRVPRWRTIGWVIVPATLPTVLSGIRLAATIALISLLSTEFLTGGPNGLGQFIDQSHRSDLVLAGVVVAGLLGLLADTLIIVVQRRCLPWAAREAGA